MSKMTSQKLAKVLRHSQAEITHIRLSIDKSSVMQCGKRQPYHEYSLGQVIIKSIDSMMDLSILKTADASHSNHYQAIAAKASRTVDTIRHAF